MPLILPLSHIHPTLKEETFHLSLPNPILGKSHYLILPLAARLTYKAVETQAKARRHLILENWMWVTEGKTEFDAINDGGEDQGSAKGMERLPLQVFLENCKGAPLPRSAPSPETNSIFLLISARQTQDEQTPSAFLL